ncbi:hypothetical protein EW146_g2529 [Bondarzewia mesenterica]|uniref:Uncharacterized protein n=1 Tax=Bondarzewia mesenterica TaxID=1095465 RepID=A0A4S4M0M0_9AGAM|nr:hypothetical protein EW146_g2529 [Bondarzewia mesenterica]
MASASNNNSSFEDCLPSEGQPVAIPEDTTISDFNLTTMLESQYLGQTFSVDQAMLLIKNIPDDHRFCDMVVNTRYGPVIKQKRFIAYEGRENEEAALKDLDPPYYFNEDRGVCLEDTRFTQDLRNVPKQDEPSPLRHKKTVKLTIGIPGYRVDAPKRQLQLWHTSQGEKVPITLRKLIEDVAKRVKEHLMPRTVEEAGVGNLAYADVVLIGYVCVSQGTIMPIIQHLQ